MIIKRMKNMTLALCLLPGLMLADSSEQMQQLQNALQAKKAELSDIEQKIAAKEKHINDIVDNMRYLFDEILAYFDKKEDRQTFDEETTAFEKAIARMAFSNQYDQELMNTEFTADCEHHKRDCYRFKFALIRIAMEYSFLKDLCSSYELCLQQLFAIKIELTKDLQ